MPRRPTLRHPALRRPSRHRPLRRRTRIALAGLGLAAIVWSAGLIGFSLAVPEPGPVTETHTDSIVVLTGGAARLEAGFALLAAGRAEKLFISGVYHGNDVRSLMNVAKNAPDDVECCVALGYAAGDTQGNARETAEWIRAQGYHSLRLVTAAYHMPRSLLLFRRAMPDVAILPHPVFPEGFKREQWWTWPGTARLVLSEYHKYLLALAYLA